MSQLFRLSFNLSLKNTEQNSLQKFFVKWQKKTVRPFLPWKICSLVLHFFDHHHNHQGKTRFCWDGWTWNSLEISKQFTGILLPHAHHLSPPDFTLSALEAQKKHHFQRSKRIVSFITRILYTVISLCHNQRPTLEKANYFCPQSLTAGLLSSEETPELILDGKANQIVVTFVAVMTK